MYSNFSLINESIFYIIHTLPYSMVWYGMLWYAMVWYGMLWYAMVWYMKRLYLTQIRWIFYATDFFFLLPISRFCYRFLFTNTFPYAHYSIQIQKRVYGFTE